MLCITKQKARGPISQPSLAKPNRRATEQESLMKKQIDVSADYLRNNTDDLFLFPPETTNDTLVTRAYVKSNRAISYLTAALNEYHYDIDFTKSDF
jgi:hypothetical protein